MIDCEMIRVRLSDHYEGFARLWLPAKPRGGVLYFHGIQSHGLWFEHSARRMVEAGFAVLLPDRRGSGRNDTERGHAASARILLRDVNDYLDDLHVRTGRDRFHLVGVSWGGKLALAAYHHAPDRIASLTLVAPGLFPDVDIPLSEKIRVGLSALGSGRTTFDIPLDTPDMFTANPERQRFIENDPLRLRQVTASFLFATRELDRKALAVASRHDRCPLKIFLAERDRIINNRKTESFAFGLNWPRTEVVEYDNAHHTLEFEPDPEPYFADLVEWLTSVSALDRQ